jgi:phospholipase/lecithinase/hemolysin
MGARHVLISNLPDLGATPEAALLGLTTQSHDVSVRFNSLIGGLEQMLENLFVGLDVDVLDMAGLSAGIVADAQQNGGAQFGIANVTTPCAGFAFSVGISCDVSLFSDALHPSARAHQILGQAALALVIPEPGMPALVAVALVGLALTRRRAA